MFENAYKDWKVQVTPRGNARIVAADGGAVALVRARAMPKNDDDRLAFGRQVLASLFNDGLVRTIKSFRALTGPRIASMLDGALNDMSGVTRGQPSKGLSADGDVDMPDSRAAYGSESVHEGGEQDHKRDIGKGEGVDKNPVSDHDRPGGKPESVLADPDDDAKDKRGKKNVGSDSILDERVVDFKDKKAFKVVARSWLESNPGADPTGEAWLAIPMGETVMLSRDGEATRQASQDEFRAAWLALDKTPIEEAARLKQHEARVRKLYEARIAKLEAEHKAELEKAGASAVDRFARCIRIVAERQRIGMEECPLKEGVATVLANRRVVGFDAEGDDLVWLPLSDDLAIHLTESAWEERSGAHVDVLLTRAAELAQKSDDYLVDAQGDLTKHAHRITTINRPEQVDPGMTETRYDAEEARRAARDGNPAFTGSAPEDDQPLPRQAKTAALREALGGTKTNSIRRQVRTP